MLYHGNLHPLSFHRFVRMWGNSKSTTPPPDSNRDQQFRSQLGVGLTIVSLIGLAIGFSLS